LQDRIPRTIELMFGAIILAHGIGIMLGVFSALRQYSFFDYALTVFTFLGVATPSFFLGLGVIVIFAAKLGWFPTSGVITPNVPALCGGATIVETIFAWPGMGSLAIDAVNARDYNTLMATLLVGTVLVLISNLIADIAYAFADPRIRYD